MKERRNKAQYVLMNVSVVVGCYKKVAFLKKTMQVACTGGRYTNAA